jgi:putative heme-binding domain-containing protein
MLRRFAALLFAVSGFAQTTPSGEKLFVAQCALCHGIAGNGGRGPALTRAKLDHAPDDAALRAVIENGIPPEMPGAWQLSPREIASLAAHVRSLGLARSEPVTGDISRGAALYAANGCAGCHIANGVGTAYGPDLSDIGLKRGPAFLRETLMNPAGSLPPGFQNLTAVTAAGETVSGIRVNEDTFTVQLRDAQGRFHSFRKTELKELLRSSKESPMPAYSNQLSVSELEDLVAYLASLRGKS